MKLTPPTTLVFWISVALGILGLLGTFAIVPALAGFASWLLIGAWVLLVLGNMVKGM